MLATACGVPTASAQRLVALIVGRHAIIRSDFVWDILDQQGIEAILPHSFTPERGTGQGDIHSPFRWLAVFDVLLIMLAADKDSPDHIYLPKSDGTLYQARDVCYADDLQSQARTLRGLQRMADLVAVYTLVSNLSIAFNKLRVFHSCGLSLFLPNSWCCTLLGGVSSGFPSALLGPFVALTFIVLLLLLMERPSSPVTRASAHPYIS